ncbi:MAG TPA: flagellar assembly protein T N-terminal domain-containing protein, partial [Polyangia bacterium]|nr:flagellar assembly protein T N-terminal domain-containing protein [Polyangia bacterium]
MLRWGALRHLVLGEAIAVLFLAMPATAQTGDRVVSAEAPIVNGNAVVAKQRALAEAFRQAVERAFSDLLKESGSGAQPLPGGLMQLKASFANRGQRFVRSYRILEEDEANGRLRVQIDADVDTTLLRREMERARGT